MTVAWFSYFPVEWLDEVPEEVRALPRQHPATWQRVLLSELEQHPEVQLHILVLRKTFPRSFTFQRRGVTFHLLRTPGGCRASTLFWLDTWLLRRRLQRIQPHLVHAWGTEHGAALVASRLPWRNLVTVQGVLSWLGEHLPLNQYQRFTAKMERRSLARLRVVTAESSFAIHYLKSHYPGLILKQIEHAPLPLFRRLQRSPELSPRRFLFVGSVSYAKGADVLFAAVEQWGQETAEEFQLVVIGDQDTTGGKWCARLSPRLRQRICFPGLLSAENVAAEMSRAAVLIYPSRADNSPNVVKEAVVAGLPVVASHVGGIPEHVVAGRNGELFAPGDGAQCLAALRRVCAHERLSRGLVDPDLLAAQRARLSPETMGRQFLAAYHFVLEH